MGSLLVFTGVEQYSNASFLAYLLQKRTVVRNSLKNEELRNFHPFYIYLFNSLAFNIVKFINVTFVNLELYKCIFIFVFANINHNIYATIYIYNFKYHNILQQYRCMILYL